MYLLHSMLSLLIWHEQLFTVIKILKYCATLINKKIAGSEECSPNGYCLQKAELVIKHYLYTKTWQRKPPLMKKIMRDNYVNIQGSQDYGSVHCPSSHCHLSINQVSFQSLLNFPQDMAQTCIHYEKNKCLRGDNYVNIQGRIMILVHCPISHCHLSINQILFQSLLYFPRYGPDMHPLWKLVMGR